MIHLLDMTSGTESRLATGRRSNRPGALLFDSPGFDLRQLGGSHQTRAKKPPNRGLLTFPWVIHRGSGNRPAAAPRRREPQHPSRRRPTRWRTDLRRQRPGLRAALAGPGFGEQQGCARPLSIVPALRGTQGPSQKPMARWRVRCGSRPASHGAGRRVGRRPARPSGPAARAGHVCVGFRQRRPAAAVEGGSTP